MASRRKAERQLAPQTIEQAIALLAEYRDMIDTIDELRAEAAHSIAVIEAQRDAFILPLGERVNDLFRQLRAWWAVAGPVLTEGRRKSIELAGLVIGERTTPPALKLPKGAKAEEIVADLLEWLGGDYCVTTSKLDKPAIIKALRISIDIMDPVEDAVFLHEVRILRDQLGLTVAQKDEFFVDVPKKPADPVTVPETPEPVQ